MTAPSHPGQSREKWPVITKKSWYAVSVADYSGGSVPFKGLPYYVATSSKLLFANARKQTLEFSKYSNQSKSNLISEYNDMEIIVKKKLLKRFPTYPYVIEI